MFSIFSLAQLLPSYGIYTPEEAQEQARLTREGLWDWLPCEADWAARQEFLEKHGYLLRPRYHKNWTPSWLGTLRIADLCEDSITIRNYFVIDATRASDGQRVSIKLTKDEDETRIADSLCSGGLLEDPTNHCAPVLDILRDPLDGEYRLLVMPYYRPFNNPPFEAAAEVTDCVMQLLEGLAFMHNQGVAHRDCAAQNIMMDARPLYPFDHHPVRLNYTLDGAYDATYYSRLDHPVKYFFIDFGLSTKFDKGASPLVLGTRGADKSPPELSAEVPYNAFCLDIYVLGNVFYKEFTERYSGLEFLEPLVSAMREEHPSRRPTAEEAAAMCREILSSLDGPSLRRRLHSKSASTPERIILGAMDITKAGLQLLIGRQ